MGGAGTLDYTREINQLEPVLFVRYTITAVPHLELVTSSLPF